MRWQYRTVIFEFEKDGLLGDRYIDDEEMEKTLNEQGQAGWELVSATMVQDGLLTLFKRPDRTPLTRTDRVAESDQHRDEPKPVESAPGPQQGNQPVMDEEPRPEGLSIGSIRIR